MIRRRFQSGNGRKSLYGKALALSIKGGRLKQGGQPGIF